jgi:hypothetical protein
MRALKRFAEIVGLARVRAIPAVASVEEMGKVLASIEADLRKAEKREPRNGRVYGGGSRKYAGPRAEGPGRPDPGPLAHAYRVGLVEGEARERKRARRRRAAAV